MRPKVRSSLPGCVFANLWAKDLAAGLAIDRIVGSVFAPLVFGIHSYLTNSEVEITEVPDEDLCRGNIRLFNCMLTFHFLDGSSEKQYYDSEGESVLVHLNSYLDENRQPVFG